jgi:hypothetical protein
VEYPKPQFDKYRATNFSIFRQVTGLVVKPSAEADDDSTAEPAAGLPPGELKRSSKSRSRTASSNKRGWGRKAF